MATKPAQTGRYPGNAMIDFDGARQAMVSRQIEARGLHCLSLLAAMRRVPRERFVPEGLGDFAYDDRPLPIGAEQTISQPYVVALMIDALRLEGGEKVLEIGTGSGYAAAVLAEIAGTVFTIERLPELASRSSELLAELGYRNITVVHGDGTLGLETEGPFDAIIVTAGGPRVPDALKHQLRIGGRLLMPIGTSREMQQLVRIVRAGESEYRQQDLADVRFVPLIGAQGW